MSSSKGSLSKSNKLDRLIHSKVRVIAKTHSNFVGTLLSFDNHMNLVLGECEEFKTAKSRKELKRYLGLLIVRGENVVSVVLESGPNAASLKPQLRLNKNKGSAKPIVKKITRTENNSKVIGNAGVTKPRR